MALTTPTSSKSPALSIEHTLCRSGFGGDGTRCRLNPLTFHRKPLRLSYAIGAYYRQNQGRGHRCTVDAYLRVNRYHYFFAYRDDYANTYLGHDEEGHFIRRPQKPAFEIVFIFDPQDGSLEIFAQGGKEVHKALQTIFCRCLTAQEFPPELPFRHPFELNGLKLRDFGFPADPEDGSSWCVYVSCD